ncbi:F0F1 ATP synthase subunit B [Leekyejoonella antrihumi]|uniref:ATP synthase subunit b n=1 Tax=Leekyejoonella antrihumi TaxID=1660198 RepID=A0A563E2U0_9MICO|nr:F0F1 ATP synthase subunit B [Leekyejoonella antrihumi]TWP36512.1 F0F1 ATP synthase subunit B [Leekyejoonella antrihumi]
MLIHALVPAADNPLMPNGTFIAELIAFLLILGALAKWVVPPINRALVERQENIRERFEELEESQAAAKETEGKYRAALKDARHEAGEIRQRATADGEKIVAESREHAKAEGTRIVEAAHKQTEADRQQAEVQLRGHVGKLSTDLASKIVGESLEDEARQRGIVERFLGELESGSVKAEKVGSGPEAGA